MLLPYMTLSSSWRHAMSAEVVATIRGDEDIVLRGAASATPAPTAAPATPATERADAVRSITPDPVLLFRYSALTFNAHRLPYDRDYARDVEGYAGLVVHGPLLAPLLMAHAQRAAPDLVPRPFPSRAEPPPSDATPSALLP